MNFVRLANTLLKDEESARDNHAFWPTLYTSRLLDFGSLERLD